jgi:uncharacterized protein YidB (DUF937 family)
MGLLDQIGNAVQGGMGKSGGAQGALLQQLVGMLSKPGALNNLMGAFQGAGLGNVVQSWVSTGQNLPISPDQVRSVLGQGTVADMAKRAGMDESETANTLSGLLPELVDKATPDGKVPSQPDFGNLMSSLGKAFTSH